MALRADGLRYRPDPPDELFSWIGQCPGCRRWTLRMRIVYDDYMTDTEIVSNGRVTLGCGARCFPPPVLRAYLARDIDEIAHAAEVRLWRRRYAWALDAFHRYVETHQGDS